MKKTLIFLLFLSCLSLSFSASGQYIVGNPLWKWDTITTFDENDNLFERYTQSCDVNGNILQQLVEARSNGSWSVNTNDVTVDQVKQTSDLYKPFTETMRLVAYSWMNMTFGATMTVLPDSTLSMVFVPGQFNSLSTTGMGIFIKYPSGYFTGTNNSDGGTFSVDATGTVISSTAIVEDHAFTAVNSALDSNDPASGTGGYAYNWCKFKSWRLEKVL